MRPTLLAAALLAASLASCQSMSEGVFSLEARALVYDDNEIDGIDSGTSFDEENVDVSAYGLQAALMTPLLDLTANVDRREFEGESANELGAGLRWRFVDLGPVHPYLAGGLRYGFGLETGFDEVNYVGWDAGVGALIDLSDHWFLDVKLAYEQTLDDIDLGTTDASIDGLVGFVGIGFAF